MGWHLPDACTLRSSFLRRGLVVVPGSLDARSVRSLLATALRLVRRYGVAIDRKKGTDRLWYGVVSGDRIAAEGKSLFDLYSSRQMLEWIRLLTDSPSINPSAHVRSAININCLSKVGQGYPWHRDAVPYTALLFLTSMRPSAGGEFLIQSAEGGTFTILPAAGDLVVMDGTRCPHAVAPLEEVAVRVTVPMVYATEEVERPAGLDDYLYGTSAR